MWLAITVACPAAATLPSSFMSLIPYTAAPVPNDLEKKSNAVCIRIFQG